MVHNHPKRDRRKPRVFKLVEGHPDSDCAPEKKNTHKKNTKNTEQMAEQEVKKGDETRGEEAAKNSAEKSNAGHAVVSVHESDISAPPLKRTSKLKKQRKNTDPATSCSALKSDSCTSPADKPDCAANKDLLGPTKSSVSTNSDRKKTKSEPNELKDAIVDGTAVAAKSSAEKLRKKKKKEKASNEKKQTKKGKLSAKGRTEAKMIAKTDESSRGSKTKRHVIAGQEHDKSKTASKNVSNKKRVAPADSLQTAKQPPKKKRNFQDQVFHQMFIASKPFSMKGLIKVTKSSEAPLNYLMMSLIDKNLVIKKEFGKDAKKVLYWANQDTTSKEALAARATPEETRIAREEMSKLALQERSLRADIASLIAQPKNSDIDLKACDIEKTVAEIQSQLHNIEARKEKMFASLTKGMEGKSMKQIERELCPRRMKMRINSQREEWRKRKSKCTDFVAQMADAMEKKLKDVSKTIGIETDEAEGVALPKKYEISIR